MPILIRDLILLPRESPPTSHGAPNRRFLDIGGPAVSRGILLSALSGGHPFHAVAEHDPRRIIVRRRDSFGSILDIARQRPREDLEGHRRGGCPLASGNFRDNTARLVLDVASAHGGQFIWVLAAISYAPAVT